jgi:hypothetical protein
MGQKVFPVCFLGVKKSQSGSSSPIDFGMPALAVALITESNSTTKPKENNMLLPVLLIAGAIITTLTAPIVIPAAFAVAAVTNVATAPVVVPVAAAAYLVAYNGAPSLEN